MSCDLCGKYSDELETLDSKYQTATRKVVCGDCRKRIDEKLHFFMFRMAQRRFNKWLDRQQRKTK